MNLELGCDDYPILDQFSEEGFVNLTFEILDLVEDSEFYRFNLAASFDDEVVGMGVVVRKGIKAGFDANMDQDWEHVYRGGVRFFRAGDRSDRLVAAIGRLYEDPKSGWRMVNEEGFTAVALHQGQIDMATQAVMIKIFGRDAEPIDEECYYESFFNIDLPNRLAFWNEKDIDYRTALMHGIGMSGLGEGSYDF